MYEPNKEQKWPLLKDDHSDEETRYHKAFASKSHTRYKMTGAARIMAQWPGHWSLNLKHWFISISILTLVLFLTFNFFFALPKLSAQQRFKGYSPRSAPMRNFPTKKKVEVFVHLFVSNFYDIDLGPYFDNLKFLTKKYTNFNFNVNVVLNETKKEEVTTKKQHEQNMNMMALEELFSINKRRISENIVVEYISLMKIMDNSPLESKWRQLDPELHPFLARAVAIWEHGGIAFDPLLYNTENIGYVENINGVFKDFAITVEKIEKRSNCDEKIVKQDHKTVLSASSSSKSTKENDNPKVNNIRDVLAALDKGEKIDFFQMKVKDMKPNKVYYSDESDKNHTIRNTTMDNLDIELLAASNNIDEIPTITDNILQNNERRPRDLNFKPMILSPMANAYVIKGDRNAMVKIDNTEKLTINLNGKLIASKSPCHSFIGSIFNRILYYEVNQTTTDLINEELTIFCRGVLSSCPGVKIILT